MDIISIMVYLLPIIVTAPVWFLAYELKRFNDESYKNRHDGK